MRAVSAQRLDGVKEHLSPMQVPSLDRLGGVEPRAPVHDHLPGRGGGGVVIARLGWVQMRVVIEQFVQVRDSVEHERELKEARPIHTLESVRGVPVEGNPFPMAASEWRAGQTV